MWGSPHLGGAAGTGRRRFWERDGQKPRATTSSVLMPRAASALGPTQPHRPVPGGAGTEAPTTGGSGVPMEVGRGFRCAVASLGPGAQEATSARTPGDATSPPSVDVPSSS